MTKQEIIKEIENVIQQLKDDTLRKEGMIAAYTNVASFLAEAIEEPTDELEESTEPVKEEPVKQEKKAKE